MPSLGRATRSWGWLLRELGYEPFQKWSHGRSWRLDHYAAYLEDGDGFEVELVAETASP